LFCEQIARQATLGRDLCSKLVFFGMCEGLPVCQTGAEREFDMKMKTRIAAALLAAGMIAAPAAMMAQGPPPYGQGYGPGPQGPGGWDAPPSGFTRDIQRNGWRDGMNGASKDFENRRSINVNNRDEYRNYRGPEPRVYRTAFRAGYQAWWRHQGPRRY